MEQRLPSRQLDLLARLFPTRSAAFSEIINLKAILNLPKGTEHFISDVHGEYEAFRHILNNCSGVIREKVELLFPGLTAVQKDELCTLIYYPEEVMRRRRDSGAATIDQLKQELKMLLRLAAFLSSKYTRSKVRRFLPNDYSYIIDELLHAPDGEDNSRQNYHERIIDAIMDTGSSHHFIKALSALIKRLAVDRLHLVGDLFDRGPHPDLIVDLLMQTESVDIEWGNHDIAWMGAACGSLCCIAEVVRNNVIYGNYALLENGYGISLRNLALFAHRYYKQESNCHRIDKAITMLSLKLQGQLVLRHPEWGMQDRLLLSKLDLKSGTVRIANKDYALTTVDFPTLQPGDPYALSAEEQDLIGDLRHDFTHSERLKRHVDFLFQRGSMYRCCNGNLIYHGCVPLNRDGTFSAVECQGEMLSGRAYLDYVDQAVRYAWQHRREQDLDLLWYLWCGPKSPLSGRTIKTFERALVADRTTWEEPRDPYYELYHREEICAMILEEFGLDPLHGHIINGHTPVKAREGEDPVRGRGRLIVIDGGFAEHYHATTGLAGYTLIYNSHGLRLKSHRPFRGIDDAIEHMGDIHSESRTVETFAQRMSVADTDDGAGIRREIAELSELLSAYRSYRIKERPRSGD
ncbi:MAG: fructose-1,6-bisphosphatase [Succinivibrio sp.]|nr:fructose-1,6-bisphosphatase [Succinivibrio sp.]